MTGTRRRDAQAEGNPVVVLAGRLGPCCSASGLPPQQALLRVQPVEAGSCMAESYQGFRESNSIGLQYSFYYQQALRNQKQPSAASS